jgi:uncharacterized FlgJ-related protein
MKTITLLLILGLSSIASSNRHLGTKAIVCITAEQVVVPAEKSCDQEIFDIALELGADTLTSRIIVAQARFESGKYTNNLFVKHNNIFSMQHPRIRKTTSLGPKASAEKRRNKYASYKDIRDSVTDLFLYFKARKIDKRQPSVDAYVKLLKRKNFFEDTLKKYRSGVKNELKEIKL